MLLELNIRSFQIVFWILEPFNLLHKNMLLLIRNIQTWNFRFHLHTFLAESQIQQHSTSFQLLNRHQRWILQHNFWEQNREFLNRNHLNNQIMIFQNSKYILHMKICQFWLLERPLSNHSLILMFPSQVIHNFWCLPQHPVFTLLR